MVLQLSTEMVIIIILNLLLRMTETRMLPHHIISILQFHRQKDVLWMLNWCPAKWTSVTSCSTLTTRYHMCTREERGIDCTVHTNAACHSFQQPCQSCLGWLWKKYTFLNSCDSFHSAITLCQWNWQMLLSMCKIYYFIKYLVISTINEKGKLQFTE